LPLIKSGVLAVIGLTVHPAFIMPILGSPYIERMGIGKEKEHEGKQENRGAYLSVPHLEVKHLEYISQKEIENN
jgi:hypothetical protein